MGMSDKRKTLEQIFENTYDCLKGSEQLPDQEFSTIILPVIRNTIPALLAEELCKVQPMFSPHSKEDWPYQIDVLPFSRYSEIILMKQWCIETLVEGEWTASVQFFAFKTEEDLNWFKIRWL